MATTLRPVPAADRGRLVVAEKVVAKIATQAAREVSPDGGGAAPRVRVTLADNVASLTVELGVAFPRPIRATVIELQQHLTRRLQELAGVRVARIDVRIVRLTPIPVGEAEAHGVLA
jgi:uncharacterized alkaline shock family protein YloU